MPHTQAKPETSSRPTKRQEAPVPCSLSQQRDESAPFAVVIAKPLQNDGRDLAWTNPGPAEGPGMCCLLRFTLPDSHWAAAAIISEVYYIRHMPTSYSSLHTLHSDCNKVQIQYLLWMGFPDFSEGGEAPLCFGREQIKPRYFLFNILCQLPPRPVQNHCPNDFAKQRQQSQTSRDCCRKPAGSKQRGTGRGLPPTLPRSCLSMESMLGGLERDGAARVHLREDTGVTPNLFHIKPLYLINKQVAITNKQKKNLYNWTKILFESEQREADSFTRMKLSLIAKIRKCVRVCARACVQIQEGESDKKELLCSCMKVVKLSS